MSMGGVVRRALQVPPRQLAGKIARKLRRGLAGWGCRQIDRHFSTYGPMPACSVAWPTLFHVPSTISTETHENIWLETAERACAHEFDLLGSGFIVICHGMRCKGVGGYWYPSGPKVHPDPQGNWLAGRVNSANLPRAQHCWRLVDNEYTPIDWHLDAKSGWRWRENIWYRDVRYGQQPGTDVKFPWELARMQHLPTIALAALVAEQRGDGVAVQRFAREFRNQILDFIATNPPRYGVNWHCTMDVAIRVANWLVAYDLLRQYGLAEALLIEENFARVFQTSIFDHAAHIANNLEWSPELRGNHYLADIVGLLFATAWLPRSRQTDAWLAFAVGEFVRETELQFDADGANFEASTCYHRLSAEMVLHGTALILSLSEEKRQSLRDFDRGAFRGPTAAPTMPPRFYPACGGSETSPFSERHFALLAGMARFSRDCTKPDGTVVQFGDNDSGRFLRFLPRADPSDPTDSLRHHELQFGMDALLSQPFVSPSEVPRGLLQGIFAPLQATGDTLSTGSVVSYPSFGLFVYRNENIYCAIRCGGVGQNGFGGHAHNDFLSLELALEGVSFLIDPGTFLYTPMPLERNQFRATAAHNALALCGREVNSWMDGPDGLFRLRDRANARVLLNTEREFLGMHEGYGFPCYRHLVLSEKGISCRDDIVGPGDKVCCFHLAPGTKIMQFHGTTTILERQGVLVQIETDGSPWTIDEGKVSRGYGLVEPCVRLRTRTTENTIHWQITNIKNYS